MRRTLLFPALMFAQAAAPASKSAPSTAASSGSYPVKSTAAKNRARQFGYFESGKSARLYAAFSEQMKRSGGGVQLTTCR